MTLIEVAIAMALLVFVVTAAVAMMYQVAQASHTVRMRTIASALAWSRVERARHMRFEDIEHLVEEAPGNLVDADGLPAIGGAFQRQTLVESYVNGLPMKRISVDVRPRNRKTNTFTGEPECVETVIAQIPLRGADE